MYSRRSQRIALFLLATLVTTVLFSERASAQYSSSWIGVRAGASIASEAIDLPDGASSSFKIGPIGGIEYDHWFNENSGISASVLYTAKGINENYGAAADSRVVGNTIYSGDDNFSFNYIEIPIVYKLSFGYGDIKPYVFAGPSIGMLLSASEAPTETIPPVNDLKSHLNTLDISAYFGAGIIDRIYQGPTIFLDLGYAAGLTKVYKEPPPERTPGGPQQAFPLPIDPTNAKSSDIRVTIGVMWKIGQ